MPQTEPPRVTAIRTTAACRLRFLPCSHGEITLPSSCWTANTRIRAINASRGEFVTSVTRTASTPLMRAPRIGTYAPTNVMTAKGMASGTSSIVRPMPMITASMSATTV